VEEAREISLAMSSGVDYTYFCFWRWIQRCHIFRCTSLLL